MSLSVSTPRLFEQVSWRRALAFWAWTHAAILRLYIDRHASPPRTTLFVTVPDARVTTARDALVAHLRPTAEADAAFTAQVGSEATFAHFEDYRYAWRLCPVCGGDLLVCADCQLAHPDAPLRGTFCPQCAPDPCGGPTEDFVVISFTPERHPA